MYALPGMRGEHRQEAVLLGAEVDGPPVAPQFVGDRVEDEVVAERDRIGRSWVRSFGQKGQSAAELFRVDRAGKRRIEAEAKRMEAGIDRVDGREVNDPQARPATTLKGQVFEQPRARGRLADDRDVRTSALEERDERRGIGDHPDGHRQGEDRPLGREGDPGRSSPEIQCRRLTHARQRPAPAITGCWAPR